MAKKEDSYTEDEYNESEYVDPNTGEIVPIDAGQVQKELNLFHEAEVKIDLSQMVEEAGFNAEKIPLQHLSGRPFIINWMNQFQSSYNKLNHAWHCICTDPATGNRFRTVIGCTRGVEALDACARHAQYGGIRVRFVYHPKEANKNAFYELT